VISLQARFWPSVWVEVYLYSSTTTAIEGSEWSAARPGRTLPPEQSGTHCTGGWVGRSGRAENIALTGFDPRTVQPVVSRYTDSATRPTPTDLPPGNDHGAHCSGGCVSCNGGQVVLIRAEVRTVGRPVRSLANIPTTLPRHLIFTHCVLLIN
jgi:hypothetical protein